MQYKIHNFSLKKERDRENDGKSFLGKYCTLKKFLTLRPYDRLDAIMVFMNV